MLTGVINQEDYASVDIQWIRYAFAEDSTVQYTVRSWHYWCQLNYFETNACIGTVSVSDDGKFLNKQIAMRDKILRFR